MHEIVFADADPESVRLYNKRTCTVDNNVSGSPAMRPLHPPVDWDGNGVAYGPGIEVSVLFDDEPEDREVKDLIETLAATAATIRKVES